MTGDSFAPDDSFTIAGPQGQRGHRDLVDHTERFVPKLWPVTDGVWCFVGNGLSNQTFVEGPEGIIVIDTGESNEEMASALGALREVTSAPIAAVIYTHFHYVAGTQAVLDEVGADIDIWGHSGIVGNRRRVTSEVSAAASRGLVQQFGMLLDHDGPDGLINVGLGREFRRAEHAPFTPGFVAPTRTITDAMSVQVAGLACEFTPAPSDADDSITIWFPEKGTCVHNIVWPALFNVFAIRGEEYRDPRILLGGLDHIAGLNAKHLVGAHRSTPSVESPLVAECLARLFANAVDAKDARDAAQAMALAATFCADGASTPLVEGAVFRDAARAAIHRVGSDAFWDEQLLTGAESELRLTRLFEEGAWDRGQDVNDVDDAVDHVQTVLFNRLVATAHSMRLLGEDAEVVRRFAERSARLYQLPRARRHAARETLL